MVVLDSQFLSIDGGISELWHDDGDYSEAEVLRLWDELLVRFGTKWNLLALDIKNEPHGSATWDGNVPTAWNLFCERFITVSSHSILLHSIWRAIHTFILILIFYFQSNIVCIASAAAKNK